MAEKKSVPTEKNPVGAAVLSAIFPGVGFFYIGNVVKGIAYVAVFAALIVLQVEARGTDNVAFGLMLAGFYIFQVFDSYNEAKKTNASEIPAPNGEVKMTLFGSIVIVIIGIFFQLAELDVIRYRDITKFWPLILIAVGAKFIYSYSVGNKKEETGNNYPIETGNGGQHE